MKTNKQIRDAYFQLLEKAESENFEFGKTTEQTYQRLVKGFGWMEKNGFSRELSDYLEENYQYEYLIEKISNDYYGIDKKKDKKSAKLLAEYCLNNDVRYNQNTKKYEKI